MTYGPEVSKKTLMDRIILYREQNGLEPIDYLSDVLENYWCVLPENIGKCEPKELPLGLMDYIRGGVAVIKNYMYSSFASQETAEKRAKQCAGCKYNGLLEKSWVDVIAINSVGGKRTAQYDRLGRCDVCLCALNGKVFWSGKVPATEEQLQKYEEINCWQLNILDDDARKLRK